METPSQWLAAVNWLLGCSLSLYQSSSRAKRALMSPSVRYWCSGKVAMAPAIFCTQAKTAATRMALRAVTGMPALAALPMPAPKLSMTSWL